MDYQELSRIVRQYPEGYLYGAGIVAAGAYRAVSEFFPVRIRGFLVTEGTGQARWMDGLPVMTLEEAREALEEALIIITAPEEYHEDMEKNLKCFGLLHYIKLDCHTEYALMGTYLKKMRNLRLIEDYETRDAAKGGEDIGVYMAVSHRDKLLKRTYQDESWIKKIQVGAALTDQRIGELTDEGDCSLSEYNDLYGELTASYYAWKHGKYRITGLFHYRRVLKVTEGQLGLLKEGRVDVILPLPYVCIPDASGQYGRYLLAEDIEAMLQVLRDRDSGHFAETEEILKTPYLYNYNMLIARKEVFDDYCGWMFPLLKEIERLCRQEERLRADRYMGRIGEVLTSIYFMRNDRGWTIAHAERIWRI